MESTVTVTPGAANVQSTPPPKQVLTTAQSTTASQIRKACEEAVASLDFLNRASLIKKALKALEVRDPEARFRKLFKEVAIRNLLSKATKDASGNVPYPSDAALTTEVERLFANRKANQAKA